MNPKTKRKKVQYIENKRTVAKEDDKDKAKSIAEHMTFYI